MLSLLLLLACSGQGAAPEPAPDTPAVEPGPEAPAEAPEACADTPSKRYVGNTEECPRIRFACQDGEQYFSDDCGCGCETSSP
ncbi:MAG: hypothetical protein H6741_01570 [Alphaproteobacteria bacterium]|nr:hypothetical protein [Alphaproteobacteria bacterium]